MTHAASHAASHAGDTGASPAPRTVDQIRARFPALMRQHNGHPVAYFDGPGGTQVPQSVADAVADYLLHHNANTHWAYPTSAETDAMLDAARAGMADLLGASAREIAFANNMTTGTFHLARALGRAWGPRDEIVITDLDHHANVAPWTALARERGVVIRRVSVRLESGQLDLGSLRAAIGPHTRLVAIGAASNALGTVSDVAEAARLAHAAGALVFVDAVHYTPHALVDVRAMDCDFLGCSAYKFYGPHIGVIYGRESLLANIDAPRLDPAPDYAPERLETGTQNHEGIVGAAAAVDFLAWIGGAGAEGAHGADGTAGADGADRAAMRVPRRVFLERAYAAMHQRGSSLLLRLWDGLASVDGVTLYGPTPDEPRTPTLSFTLQGMDSERVTRALADRGVFTSHGDFYASTIVALLGHAADGLVRAGASCYTTADEVDRLVDGVRSLAP